MRGMEILDLHDARHQLDEHGQFYSHHFYHFFHETLRHRHGCTILERINHSFPNLLLLQCSFHTLSMLLNANAENSQHCDWNRRAISGNHTVCVAQTHSRSAERRACVRMHTNVHTHPCSRSYVLEMRRTSNCSAAHPRFICHWANYSLCCEYQSAQETDATQSLTQGTRN